MIDPEEMEGLMRLERHQVETVGRWLLRGELRLFALGQAIRGSS